MNAQYKRRLEKIEAVLDEWLPARPDQDWLGRVFGDLDGGPSQAEALIAPGRDLVKRGGKRWRPLLMTLIAEGLGGGDRALPLTPLVELPHNASLIHDDIEDRSAQRRGLPAAHILYGEDAAINAGSFLYFLPLSCLSRWAAGNPGPGAALIAAAWGERLRRLHLGQSLDISWHRDFASMPSLGDYNRMCRLKTGSLARLSAVLGVLAGHGAPASPEAQALAASLGEGAEQLGTGFQILDDVKNLTTGIPGKQRGDDIVEGKKSLPALLYLQGDKSDSDSDESRLDRVIRCFTRARETGVSAPEVEELIGELERTGALAEAARLGKALIAEGRACFTSAPGLTPESRALLGGLADDIG